MSRSPHVRTLCGALLLSVAGLASGCGAASSSATTSPTSGSTTPSTASASSSTTSPTTGSPSTSTPIASGGLLKVKGATVRAPAGWKIENADSGSPDAYFDAPSGGESEIYFQTTASLTVNPLPFAQQTKIALKNFSGISPGLHVGEPLTVDGTHLFRLEGEVTGRPTYATFVGGTRDGVAYILRFMIPTNGSAAARTKLIDSVIASMAFS